MSDLRDLYQEVIIDHSKHPRNCRRLEDANHSAKGYNPLCGDRLTLYVKIREGLVEDISFEGSGCAISTASVSMLTEALKGRSEKEARGIFRRFMGLMTAPLDEDSVPPELGKLAVFAGVKEFPSRVKCATLAWHTLEAALDDRSGEISNE